MSGPVAAWWPDGRLHLQHRPIDVIAPAEGRDRAAAPAAAEARFAGLLEALVAELPALRAPAGSAALAGRVARRMGRAAAGRGVFVTDRKSVV